jgi:hypothetical protein
MPVRVDLVPRAKRWLNCVDIACEDMGHREVAGARAGGDTPKTRQFGDLGRKALRGPDFTWSDLCLTKRFVLAIVRNCAWTASSLR